MERTEQMYTIQKQMDFGKIKVRGEYVELVVDESKRLWRNDADPVQIKTCRPSLLTWTDCAPAAVSSGVIIAVAEEAWRAGRLHRRAQHLEGFQPQELLPVSFQ